MRKAQQGKCHCGDVTLSFSEQPELTFFCHCEDCQRTSGSPFSVELMVPADSFQSRGELATYTVVGESGKSVHRRSCSKCGSALLLECEADPDFVFIKAGALDDASWVHPEMHIFASCKQPWIELNDGLPQFDRMPPEKTRWQTAFANRRTLAA
jgi:hypothetical protein